MKKLIILLASGLIFGAGLSGFVLAGFNRTSLNQNNPAAVVGGIAPDFSLNALNGGVVRLSQFRGKSVLINFWASWCEPCKAEMPLIERYAEKHPDDLVVLGLDSEETPVIVQSFVASMGIKFTILLDQGGTVSDLYRVDGFPTSIFIDSNGRIQAEQIGSLSDESMNRSLASVGVKP